jgi:hypothetical protein
VTWRWERVSDHFHLIKLKKKKMRHTASLAAAYGKNSRRFIVGGNAKANLTQAEASVSFFLVSRSASSHTRLLSVILTDLIVSLCILLLFILAESSCSAKRRLHCSYD